MGAWVRAGVVLLMVFAAGFLSGILFERQRSLGPAALMSATQEHQATIAELKVALDLDDQQLAQIHSILARSQQVVQLKWEELRPEVQQAMRQVHVDIAELLRPDQRERFHDWLIKRRAEHESAIIQHER